MAKQKKKRKYRSGPRAESPRPYRDYERSSDPVNEPQKTGSGQDENRRSDRSKRAHADAPRTVASGTAQKQSRTSAQREDAAREPAKTPRGKTQRHEKLPRNVEPFTFEEAKSSRSRRRREPSGRSSEIVYRLLLAAMICAALFFIASVFFEVKNIEVTGTSRYLPEYVAGISGVETGDKLLFINKFEISQNLFAELPYVKEVKVRQRFPNTVVIEITERVPAAKLVSSGISYIVDEEAYLLEYTALGDEYRLPVIRGITLSGGTPGEQLTFEDPLILESLQNILTELVNSDWIANISEINMERIYDISFTYADRFTVVLGDASELEYKLAVFDVVLARLQESLSESEQEGIIDLSSPEMARFQPYST